MLNKQYTSMLQEKDVIFEIYKIFYVLQKTNSFSLDIQKEKNLYTS